MNMPLLNGVLSALDKRTSLQKAIDWIKKHRINDSGIAVHNKTNKVSQEVTGYIIGSLFNANEKELAYDLANWEARIQQKDGSFLAPDGIKYTFDTAQVMRGFLSVIKDLPSLEINLKKAADYVTDHIDENGEVITESYSTWKLPDGTFFSRYCDLYVLPPLMNAGKYFNEPRYINAVNRSIEYFKSKTDLTKFKPQLGTLAHIFGYMMEALAELGETQLAQEGLNQAEIIQNIDGSIPAHPGVKWICPPGIAQLGLAWIKVGNRFRAQKALNYLESIQNPTGGFYASFGKGAEYLPGKEVSWANKFFIDLYLLIKGDMSWQSPGI